MSESERYVKVIPTPRVKKETLQKIDKDAVYCRICPKGFASEVALRNHARVEHFDVYVTGDPTAWTSDKKPPKQEIDDPIPLLSEQILDEMKPKCIIALTSDDGSYIIVQSQDTPDGKSKRKRATKMKKGEKRVVSKKVKVVEPYTGAFKCLQPSALAPDGGTCHKMFSSCCEYSIHYRDEHTKRKKVLRCQVCENLLASTGVQQIAPFFCELCGVGYQTNQELLEHTFIAHVKPKPFECSLCHKRFTQQGGLLQHMRLHTGDRPFACTYCAKSFTQKSGLDQHLRTHTKEKPYCCVICSKTFSQSIQLRQHMRTHTGLAPFQCRICEKRFKQGSHLNSHLKYHNPATMSDEQRAKYAESIGAMNTSQVLTEEIIQFEMEVDTESFEVIEQV